MSGAEIPDVPEPVPLSNVAHELLSPLAAMRGYLELIAKEGLEHFTDRQKAHLEVALLNADRLQHFIEDLIELARLEAGQAEYSPTLVSPSDLLELQLRGMRKQVAEADLAVRLETPAIPPASLDVRGIGRVIDRALNHALQYVPTGGTLDIKVFADGNDVVWHFLEHAVVFEPDELKQLFDRFSQPYFAEAGRRLKQGTLALCAAKRTVEFHGGKMWAEPTPKGLLLAFRVPKDGKT